jgi:hypothetical protein
MHIYTHAITSSVIHTHIMHTYTQAINASVVFVPLLSWNTDNTGTLHTHTQISYMHTYTQAINASVVFVPLLSWNTDSTGSLGNLSTMTPEQDRVDTFLLQLIVALALRSEQQSAVRAILPVLIGPADKGTFSPFPFHKLQYLSDSPSHKTNKLAAVVLSKLGVRQEKIDDMMSRSVSKTVELILRNHGIQASEESSNIVPFSLRPGAAFIHACANKVLRTVQQELCTMRTDPMQFSDTRPMTRCSSPTRVP